MRLTWISTKTSLSSVCVLWLSPLISDIFRLSPQRVFIGSVGKRFDFRDSSSATLTSNPPAVFVRIWKSVFFFLAYSWMSVGNPFAFEDCGQQLLLLSPKVKQASLIREDSSSGTDMNRDIWWRKQNLNLVVVLNACINQSQQGFCGSNQPSSRTCFLSLICSDMSWTEGKEIRAGFRF